MLVSCNHCSHLNVIYLVNLFIKHFEEILLTGRCFTVKNNECILMLFYLVHL